MLRLLQYEAVQVWLRRICLLWSFYAHTAGILVLSFALALLLVSSYDSSAPVFEHSKTIPPRLITPKIKRDGLMSYVVHTRQNKACPGEIVTTFTSQNVNFPAVVTLRRPVTRPDIGVFRDFPAVIDVPDSVYPGHWKVTIAADSRCPLRNIISKIAEFSIEVEP